MSKRGTMELIAWKCCSIALYCSFCFFFTFVDFICCWILINFILFYSILTYSNEISIQSQRSALLEQLCGRYDIQYNPAAMITRLFRCHFAGRPFTVWLPVCSSSDVRGRTPITELTWPYLNDVSASEYVSRVAEASSRRADRRVARWIRENSHSGLLQSSRESPEQKKNI